MNVSSFVTSVAKKMSKHSPAILTGIGITGMISTTILAVKATPKAVRLLEKRETELELATDERLTAKEVVKTTWKLYIPAAVTCAGSIACLIGANTLSSKRQAALATAYTLSETAFSEYRESVKEVIGEKKEKAIQDKVAEKRIQSNPPSSNEKMIYQTGYGNTLCYDAWDGGYFYCDVDRIQSAINILNNELNNQDYVSLNDFYELIGLPPSEKGEYLGWNRMRDGLVEIVPSTQLADGKPCYVINYRVAPRYDYSKYS